MVGEKYSANNGISGISPTARKAVIIAEAARSGERRVRLRPISSVNIVSI